MTEFRPRPAVVLRTAGFALVLLALVVLGCLVVSAWAGWPLDWVLLVAAAGVAAIAVAAAVSARRVLVRLTPDRLELHGVRGSQPSTAAWTEITRVSTSYDAQVPILVLELRDGSRVRIPVGALACDKEDFVRAIEAHLVPR